MLVVASCTGASVGETIDPTPSHVPSTPLVYAAIGASETVGVGTTDPLRDAWPRVLWRTLPAGSTLYDLGVPGALASQALVDQVPRAVRLQPDLVTVWLNVNDLISGVPPERFGRTLQEIVARLRGDGGTIVLVANVPRVEELPVYVACTSPGGTSTAHPGTVVRCPPEVVGLVPGRDEVRAAIAAYNRVTQELVGTEGAILVDLHGLAPSPAERPELIADDGFHPSSEGAEVIATLFADAWARAHTGTSTPDAGKMVSIVVADATKYLVLGQPASPSGSSVAAPLVSR